MVCQQCAEWTRHTLPAAVFELVHRMTKRTIEHIRHLNPGQLISNPWQIAIIRHQATTARIAQQRPQLTTSDAAIRQKEAKKVIDPSEQHHSVPCAERIARTIHPRAGQRYHPLVSSAHDALPLPGEVPDSWGDAESVVEMENEMIIVGE